MMKIQDLDVLRPEPQWLRIGGKDIDVSFIPCGITFDVDAIVMELRKLNQEKVAEGGEESRKAFDLAIRLCSTFCRFRYPEFDTQWFMENADPRQVGVFSTAIQETLYQAYKGVGEPKNQEAVKHRK